VGRTRGGGVKLGMKSKPYRIAGRCLPGALLGWLLFLTGCADSPPWGAWSKIPSATEIAAVTGHRPETFIYFSRYEVYQNDRTKEYVYQEDHQWVHSSHPPVAISEGMLQSSPSAKVLLAGEPEQKHAVVRQVYPSDWRHPSGVMAAAP